MFLIQCNENGIFCLFVLENPNWLLFQDDGGMKKSTEIHLMSLCLYLCCPLCLKSLFFWPIKPLRNQQGPTVQHRELHSIFCNNAYGKRIQERTDTCICTTEPPHCTPETKTTPQANYIPINTKQKSN